MFIQSDKIRIFPTSNRTAGDTGTNWVTEYNLASIINRLVDKPAFLISQTFDGNIIEFNINGYYICANVAGVLSELPEGSTSLYAGIKIRKGNSTSYNAIIQTDLGEGAESYADHEVYDKEGNLERVCKLVEFSAGTFIEDDYISIQLLTKASGSWELEPTSKIMYDRNRISGIDEVDNTSDINKPVSNAQTAAITAAKKEVQDNLNTHIDTKSGNPHNVTKGEVGLGNVSNVSTIDQVTKDSDANISSGGVFSYIESLKTGDIKPVEDKIDDHIGDKENPHGVSKSQVGLGNVEDCGQTTDYTTTYQDDENKKKYFTQQGANSLYQNLCGQLSTLTQNLQSIDEGELD